MKQLFLLFLSALTAGGLSAADPPLHHITVEVYHDIILPCSAGSTDLIPEIFDWKRNNNQDVFFYEKGSHYNNDKTGQDEQFKARVEHFSDQLEHGNASIKIKNTKVSDSGIYTCTRVISGNPVLLSRINLTVDCILKDRTTGPNAVEGACSKPTVDEIIETNSGMVLQCSVLVAFPKPKVEWQDSSKNTVQFKVLQDNEARGYYNIIIRAVVNKTDDYRCVATQPEICHENVSNWISVNVPEKNDKTTEETPDSSSVNIPIIGVIVSVTVITVVILLLLVALMVTCKKKPKEDTAPKEVGVSERESGNGGEDGDGCNKSVLIKKT